MANTQPKRRRFVSSALATALLLPGMSLADTLSIREESPAPFSEVRVDVPADFTIRIGQPAAVSVKAEPDVLKAIRVSSTDGVLRVDSTGSFRTRQPVTIMITAPSLTALQVAGASAVTVDRLQGEQLSVDASGSSEVSLPEMNLQRFIAHLQESSALLAAGSATSQQVQVNESASYEGQDLQTASTRLVVSDAGSAQVRVEQDLDVSVKDAGSVTYSGQPSIRKSISDAGSLDRE